MFSSFLLTFVDRSYLLLMYLFRLASMPDFTVGYHILHESALHMVALGRHQWDAQYPQEEDVRHDIACHHAYVVEVDGKVVAYGAVSFEGEPSYEHLQGTWLTGGKYAVVHRCAVALSERGKGLSTFFFRQVEDLCKDHQCGSIRIDTNYDNVEMLGLLNALGYQRCGICHYHRNGSTIERIAFEKVLK